ncbi:MAG TPA: hypothetical protein VMR34_01950 [Candidatus Saccharimonadales bacterium]|nr:hypothetical protein [Candidatus Saccharimonadales bacterium]
MAVICPSITAMNEHLYRTQMERIENVAKRIHIDLSDERFAPSRLVDIKKIWWPDHLRADLHLMCSEPENYLDEAIRLKPKLVIVHAEADGNHMRMAQELHSAGIKFGVALLPITPPDFISQMYREIDHVLVFAGHLGYFGGVADMSQLRKVRSIREVEPDIEIGWDGGINDKNIEEMANAGVDVFNVGGFIQHSKEPAQAYAKLSQKVGAGL